MLRSPGLAGENSSPAVVDRSLYYEAPLFLYPVSFLPLFFFFYFGLHQNREDIFLLLSISENVIDYLSAFVEFGLAMLKVEFDSFFSMPFVCPPFSPSVGLGPDWLLPQVATDQFVPPNLPRSICFSKKTEAESTKFKATDLLVKESLALSI